MATANDWPQELEPVTGPFTAARIDGAVEGMGEYGPVTRAVAERGLVQPDLVTGMTLFLLARQPQPAPAGNADEENADEENADEEAEKTTRKEASKAKASPIAGGVWVRERFTIHRPLERTDPFVITGSSTGREVRKGRRYGTTISQSVDSDDELVATNLTTGLLAYEAVDGLADEVEGLAADDTPSPIPDQVAAMDNPHLDELEAATVGQVLGGDDVVVSLAMMAARDTASPDNPIHSDPAAARAAGLARPIAGGSHVLAFALEPIMAAFGPDVLLHGAHFDIRWKAPTQAEATIVPRITVIAVEPSGVHLDLDVGLDDGTTAMVGSIAIPFPATSETTA